VDVRPGPYDLLWPVEHRRRPPVAVSVQESTSGSSRPASNVPGAKAEPSLGAYAMQLLSSQAVPNPRSPPFLLGPGVGDREEDVFGRAETPLSAEHREDREETGGGLSGCREAVEILTRNMKKGTFFLSSPFQIREDRG
jgi:RAB6A-GEF complex partner protein 2